MYLCAAPTSRPKSARHRLNLMNVEGGGGESRSSIIKQDTFKWAFFLLLHEMVGPCYCRRSKYGLLTSCSSRGPSIYRKLANYFWILTILFLYSWGRIPTNTVIAFAIRDNASFPGPRNPMLMNCLRIIWCLIIWLRYFQNTPEIMRDSEYMIHRWPGNDWSPGNSIILKKSIKFIILSCALKRF